MRVAIVDDEKSSIDRVAGFLKTYFEKKGLEHHIDTFSGGDKLLFQYRPIYDIIILDIEMFPIDGIKTAKNIRRTDSDVVIIFITKMAQCAINGYEVNALGFIVKPVDGQSVWLNLDKARAVLQSNRGKEILLDLPGGIKKLPFKQIYYVEASDHDLIYHTGSGSYQIHRKTLSDAAAELDERFKKYSRSYLVNLDHISEVSGTEIIVADNKIFISREKRRQVMQDLAARCGRE